MPAKTVPVKAKSSKSAPVKAMTAKSVAHKTLPEKPKPAPKSARVVPAAKSSPAKPPAAPKIQPITYISMAQAAKALGVTEAFTLNLTLSGARRPTDQGGQLVELEYTMDGNELVFTEHGVDRFLKQCPLKELVTAAKAAERLGIHRSQVSMLIYTGIQTEDGRVMRLPVWMLGGGEHVVRQELDEFEVEYRAWSERKAARELKKRYKRPGKQGQES